MENIVKQMLILNTEMVRVNKRISIQNQQLLNLIKRERRNNNSQQQNNIRAYNHRRAQ